MVEREAMQCVSLDINKMINDISFMLLNGKNRH